MDEIKAMVNDLVEENARLRRQLACAQRWARYWKAAAKLYHRLSGHYARHANPVAQLVEVEVLSNDPAQ